MLIFLFKFNFMGVSDKILEVFIEALVLATFLILFSVLYSSVTFFYPLAAVRSVTMKVVYTPLV